jgi:hypothetical protein
MGVLVSSFEVYWHVLPELLEPLQSEADVEH